MSKFLRKIRYNLMDTGKTSKYFKYAIGEIVLVVIGILIALSINNWNEQKKLKIQEAEVLTEIISDINVNINKFNETINGKNRLGNINNTLRSLNIIIEHLKSTEAYHDSLDAHFGIMTLSLNYINYKTSGYESLSSIGLDLIRDAKIRSEIGEFYTTSIIIPKDVSLGIVEDFNNYMLDYMRKEFIINDDPASNIYTLHPRNYNALRDKGEFLESLKIYFSSFLNYKHEINSAKEDSNTLKTNIETYLNK